MILFLAGYIEGNSIQSYLCHIIFKLVVLYSSHLPILYHLWIHVYHLVWEHVPCDYTCHGVCQAKQKLAKPSPSCVQNKQPTVVNTQS